MPTTEVRRPEVIKFYPDVPSKVVQVFHSGVWNNNYELEPGALRLMLDAAMGTLTNLFDAQSSWTALFSPNERIGIKVSTLGPTHAPLVMAVAESLQDAGIPAENIVIFDMFTQGLEFAGYPVNKDGPGVRCYGNGERLGEAGDYTPGWTLIDRGIALSDILLSCDAVINIPGLVTHPFAGISFALKNNYGNFGTPEDFHDERVVRGIAEVSALPPIRDRTRLYIGDALTGGAIPHFYYGDRHMVGKASFLVSFDPVALDTVGLGIASEALVATGLDPTASVTMASPWLARSASQGLGTSNQENMEVVSLPVG
jgi:hypothetical protein